MSQTISYEYTSGNLLESPNNYFYTRFHGKAFIDTWIKQRDEALKTVPKSDTYHTVIGPSATDILLENLFNRLSIKSMLADDIEILNRLVQRFEVSKRLHSQYNQAWKPTNVDDFYHLDRYVRFAEVLNLAYVMTNSLVYLNAFLKCMDTLTAVRMQLDKLQIARLNILIKKERAHIQQLALKMGVRDFESE